MICWPLFYALSQRQPFTCARDYISPLTYWSSSSSVSRIISFSFPSGCFASAYRHAVISPIFRTTAYFDPTCLTHYSPFSPSSGKSYISIKWNYICKMPVIFSFHFKRNGVLQLYFLRYFVCRFSLFKGKLDNMTPLGGKMGKKRYIIDGRRLHFVFLSLSLSE